MTQQKVYSFLTQAFIFSSIMFVSGFISKLIPIPIPDSVIGLVLLFLCLCLKIVKLEQVESLGHSLTSIIGFLFVPSGISVINSLGIMQTYGIQIILVIFIATVILLAVTGLFAQFIIGSMKETYSKQHVEKKKSSSKPKDHRTA